jgi:hypothetical protein
LRGLIGVPDVPRKEWWRTDTHVIAGNWMVAAQSQERRDLFNRASAYLRGKHAGRDRTIFYDDQWRPDAAFTRQCRELYGAHADELGPLLAELGQLDLPQQSEQLTLPCAAAIDERDRSDARRSLSAARAG